MGFFSGLFGTLSILLFLWWFWSDNILLGLQELGFYKYYLIIILVFFSVFNKEDVKMSFYILVFSFGVYALFSLSIYVELFTIELKSEISNKSNPRGILKYAVVTFYMAISIFFAVYFFIKEENKKLKYIFLLIAIISFFALLVNNGRMGQLSFLATLFVLMVYYRKYLFIYKKILLSFILIIVLGGIYLYNSPKIDRYIYGVKELQYSYDKEVFTGSWGTRLFFWKAISEFIPKNLIFGAGVGDARAELIKYEEQNLEIFKHRIVKSYHNYHFELLAHFGILGYLLFAFSIFSLLKLLYKEEKHFFYIGLVFFSMLFFSSMGDSILYYKPLNNIYILIFVLLAIAVQEKLNYKDRI